MSEKLLSLVACGRNDSYIGGFLYRFKTAMAMTVQAIIDGGFADQIELVIVDWGGESPLHEILPSDGRVLHYIMVPPDVAKKASGDSEFAISIAINVGVRRARGRYIANTSADVVHTTSFFQHLVPLLRQGSYKGVDLSTAFCAIPRKHVPLELVATEPSRETLDKYLAANGNELPFDPILPVTYGSAGALLMSQEMWHRMRGGDERLIYWGWNDCDLAFRAALTGSRMCFGEPSGVYVYHMEHKSAPNDPVQPRKISPPYFNQPTVNDPQWGLGESLFEEIPPRSREESAADLADVFPGMPPVRFYKLRHLLTILRDLKGNACPSNRDDALVAYDHWASDFHRRDDRNKKIVPAIWVGKAERFIERIIFRFSQKTVKRLIVFYIRWLDFLEFSRYLKWLRS